MFGMIGAFSLMLLFEAKPSEAAISQTITDQNGDGIINLIDARILAPPDSVNCTVCVDVNADKKIDQKDLDLVQTRISNSVNSATDSARPKFNPRLDINNDGALDAKDVSTIQNYLNQAVSGSVFGLDNPSELTAGFLANDITIKFKPETPDSQKQALFTKYNLTKKYSFTAVNAANLRAPDENVENLQKQLAQEPIVQKTYKGHILELQTSDPLWSQQWAPPKIRLPETWYAETTGRTTNKIKVAVIDTGVATNDSRDYNHPDLLANLSQTHRLNTLTDPAIPFQYQDVKDEVGHGTAIAGIIGATTNNNIGVAGSNWNVEIIPVKACFWHLIDGGVCPIPYINIALDWLLSVPELDVINMSFGSSYQPPEEISDYYFDLFDQLGVTLIASAGNEGRDDSIYPASHPKVVSVASTMENDTLCPNSSGRLDANILAPGDNIMSTVSPNSPYDPDGNGYQNFGCGTSLAAAYVSGVAALCRVVAPDPRYTGRSDLKCNTFRHNGYGRIDAWATLWYKNCKRFDNNNNGAVGSLDAAGVSFRVNNPAWYNSRYDVFPVGGDGKIDLQDVYVQNSRTGARCQ